jgi:hypothetical protein
MIRICECNRFALRGVREKIESRDPCAKKAKPEDKNACIAHRLHYMWMVSLCQLVFERIQSNSLQIQYPEKDGVSVRIYEYFKMISREIH